MQEARICEALVEIRHLLPFPFWLSDHPRNRKEGGGATRIEETQGHGKIVQVTYENEDHPCGDRVRLVYAQPVSHKNHIYHLAYLPHDCCVSSYLHLFLKLIDLSLPCSLSLPSSYLVSISPLPTALSSYPSFFTSLTFPTVWCHLFLSRFEPRP